MFTFNGKIILVLIMLIIVVAMSALLIGRSFEYVGASACGKCHSRKYMLDQYEKWLSSPHARAFRTLKTAKAKNIAADISIAKPSENDRCLKCHTTGGKSGLTIPKEGVGCESCHGPGSGYADLDMHVNFKFRKNGYTKAKKYGMYPVLDYEPNLKKREKLCRCCHNRNRPCFPKTNSEITKQRITIQVIDTLRKGDVNFSHQLRRY